MSCLFCNLFTEKLSLNNSDGQRETFVVQKRLGFGGFSLIDLVVSQQNGRAMYATKRIRCFSQADIDKAVHEGRLHSQLPDHKNLLTCISYTQRQLIPSHTNQGALTEILILMPLCKDSLHSLLSMSQASHGRLEVSDLARFLSGVASGLEALFDYGVAHRDIKPGNVMLSSTGIPKLIDFGSTSTKVIEIKTHKEALKWEDFISENCSMTYRAPEMFNLTEGCLIYAMCFYESPFDQVHANGDSIALAVTSGKCKFPSPWPKEYPDSVRELICLLLQRDVHKRPTVSDVLIFCRSKLGREQS